MITATVIKITPEMAQAWLTEGAPNRPLSKAVIERYAKDMIEGRWQVNGEPLIFSDKKRMIDGQHRCSACVLARTPFSTLVVEGVSEAVFKTLGSNHVRSNADVLFMMGETNSNKLAGALRWIHQYEKEPPMLDNAKTTHQDALALLAKYPDIRQSLELCMGASRIVPATMLAMVHCLGLRIYNKTVANDFVEAIISGANLSLGNPARVLRERLMQDRAQGKGQPKLGHITVAAFTIKAFNYFAQKEPVGHYKWTRSEPFPKISKTPISTVTTHRNRPKAAKVS